MNNVISIIKYKERKIQKKESANEFAKDRTPLYVSHLTGKVSGDKNEADFGERLTRIRNSLEKINKLMAELKQSNGENN